MHRGAAMRRRRLFTLAALLVAGASLVAGQARGPRGLQPAQSPRAIAPSDFTGYWVSVVTEDWRWRMVTPAKGDYDSVPLNAAGRRQADTWDPQRDEAGGEACRAFAAPAIMRVPGRIHITWDNDTTLRIDTEAGTQTRLFRFGNRSGEAAGPAPTWQGESIAAWEMGGRGGLFGGPPPKPSGALKVVTMHIRPGYLRKNGVPFSASAVLTEYFNVLGPEDNGDRWLVVTTIVEDPQYLNTRFFTSTHFKKLPDGSSWRPTACRAS
jgi:ABC-type transport system substrate-binding protein